MRRRIAFLELTAAERFPRRGLAPSLRRRGRWAALAILAIAVLAALVVTDPLHTSGRSDTGVADNASPTSVVTVARQTLSAQTRVGGTLGYAGSSSVLVPAGTASSTLRGQERSIAAGQASLERSAASLATDRAALADARARATAARAQVSVECAGAGAASDGKRCEGAVRALATAGQDVSGAQSKVSADQEAVARGEAKVAEAGGALAAARLHRVFYGPNAVITGLPAVGRIVDRGGTLYRISGGRSVLMFGSLLATRAFLPGMRAGRDVTQLNANLEALGYGSGLGGEDFTPATSAAIEAFQSARGMKPTGELPLGSVVFEPGPVRVKAVESRIGSTVEAGPLLQVTTTRRRVSIDIEAAEQSMVRVGDRVTITLPDNRTTPGRVSKVSTVAEPASEGASGPTIAVAIAPSDPRATGHLDQAPVQVSITTATVKNVLAVPVEALLALAGGGYSLEVVASGRHRLVPVELGLFDDESGSVEVTGPGLAAGQRVLVPSE